MTKKKVLARKWIRKHIIMENSSATKSMEKETFSINLESHMKAISWRIREKDPASGNPFKEILILVNGRIIKLTDTVFRCSQTEINTKAHSKTL